MKKLPLSRTQKAVATDILRKFDTYDRQILAWYTGSGKTNVFLEFVRQLLIEKPKAKIGIVSYLHRNIKTQTSERAAIFLDEHYVVNRTDRNYGKENVYIFNPQTLFFRHDLPFKFDYLIVDEAHVGGGGPLSGYLGTLVSRHCKEKVKILGCSATPWPILEAQLFTGAFVHSRGMDKGLHEDGRLTDFEIHAEQISLKIDAEHFSRQGDLGTKYLKANFEIIRKLCIDKVDVLLKSNKKKLGSKCLVIVPPGQNCEIAKAVARSIGDSAIYLIGGAQVSGYQYEASNEEEKIAQFRTDPKIKFLCVVHKCQIGFDMPELTSTIDLTMSRNIGLVIQRWGRLARKDPKSSAKKNYFYVFDASMEPERAEWIIGTSIDYAMCKWDSTLTSKTIRRRPTKIFGVSGGNSTFSVGFKELLAMHSGLTNRTYSTMRFSEETMARGGWTKNALVQEAMRYESRTELSVKNRYVYNQLLRNYKEELNRVFPIKNELGKWNWPKIKALALKAKSRKQFRNQYGGAIYWVTTNGKMAELDKLLPPSQSTQLNYTWPRIEAIARRVHYPGKLRNEYRGAYRWVVQQQRLGELRELFAKIRRGE